MDEIEIPNLPELDVPIQKQTEDIGDKTNITDSNYLIESEYTFKKFLCSPELKDILKQKKYITKDFFLSNLEPYEIHYVTEKQKGFWGAISNAEMCHKAKNIAEQEEFEQIAIDFFYEIVSFLALACSKKGFGRRELNASYVNQKATYTQINKSKSRFPF